MLTYSIDSSLQADSFSFSLNFPEFKKEFALHTTISSK